MDSFITVIIEPKIYSNSIKYLFLEMNVLLLNICDKNELDLGALMFTKWKLVCDLNYIYVLDNAKCILIRLFYIML